MRSEVPATIETEDKDRPLREDIGLLGRILGDTVHQQSDCIRHRRAHLTKLAQFPPQRGFHSPPRS
jgi:hypothetical protein